MCQPAMDLLLADQYQMPAPASSAASTPSIRTSTAFLVLQTFLGLAYSKDLYRIEDTSLSFGGYGFPILELGVKFLGTDVFFGKIEQLSRRLP